MQSLQPTQNSGYIFSLQSFSNLIGKTAPYFSSYFHNWVGAEFSFRMCTSADSTPQQINGLARFLSPLQQDELPGLGSIHDGQYIWMLKTAHLFLCVHLHCQPLVTPQCPHLLHSRTEQENSFFLLKKGCFCFELPHFMSSRVHCDTKLRLLHSQLSCLSHGHADIYTSDNLGPFIPARRTWHFVPNQPQDVQAEHSALSLLLTHRPNCRFGPAGEKMKIIL